MAKTKQPETVTLTFREFVDFVNQFVEANSEKLDKLIETLQIVKVLHVREGLHRNKLLSTSK